MLSHHLQLDGPVAPRSDPTQHGHPSRQAALRLLGSGPRSSPVGSAMAPVGFGHRRPTYPSVVAQTGSPFMTAHAYELPGDLTARLFCRRVEPGTVRQIGQSEMLRVAFHGVRGSTPCHRRGDRAVRRQHLVVSVTPPATTRCCSTSAPGCATLGIGHPADQPFRGTCLLSHLHWDHVRACRSSRRCCARRLELDVYAPVAGRRSHGRRRAVGTRSVPPMFPIALDDLPGRHRVPRVGDESSGSATIEVMSRLIPHVGDTCGYRVTWRGARSPTSATISSRRRRSFEHVRRRDASCARRRPADPRRAVHAEEFAAEERLGPLHGRVRGLAGRRVRGQARSPSSTTTRPTATTCSITSRPAPTRRMGERHGRRGDRRLRGPHRPRRCVTRHAIDVDIVARRLGRCSARRSSSPAASKIAAGRRGRRRPLASARRTSSCPTCPWVELVVGALLIAQVAEPVPVARRDRDCCCCSRP